MIHLNTQLLALASGTFIPLLVSVLTKVKASSSTKAILNAVLAALSGAVASAIQAHGEVVWQQYAITATMAVVASIASYHGLWKPTGAADAVSNATSSFGIGPTSPPAVPNSAYDNLSGVPATQVLPPTPGATA